MDVYVKGILLYTLVVFRSEFDIYVCIYIYQLWLAYFAKGVQEEVMSFIFQCH